MKAISFCQKKYEFFWLMEFLKIQTDMGQGSRRASDSPFMRFSIPFSHFLPLSTVSSFFPPFPSFSFPFRSFPLALLSFRFGSQSHASVVWWNFSSIFLPLALLFGRLLHRARLQSFSHPDSESWGPGTTAPHWPMKAFEMEWFLIEFFFQKFHKLL